MSTYEYVEGDFPAIISQEIWDKAQAIRESRIKPVCVSAGKNTHSKRDSRDIWVNKLRCSCGSSYRKNKWHTKLDGKPLTVINATISLTTELNGKELKSV